MEIEEKEARERIFGVKDSSDSPNDEFRLDIKAASIWRNKKDSF